MRRRTPWLHGAMPWLAAWLVLGCDDRAPAPTVDAAVDAAVDAGPGPEVPVVPDLDPFSRADALAVAAYARRLRVISEADGTSHPVAWAMVNVSCEERARALQFAIATWSDDARPDPPVFDALTLTADDVRALAKRGARKVVSINITGPLITQQTLVLPDSSELAGEQGRFYWPYHEGVAINVEGELHVIDLSTGDAPIPVGDWTRGFVEPSIACQHVTDDGYTKRWTYWNPAFGNLIPPPRPEEPCGYTFTPIFTFTAGQPTQVKEVLLTPAELLVQLGGMRWRLMEYGVTLDDEELPSIISRYAPLTEADLCAWVPLNYCDRL